MGCLPVDLPGSLNDVSSSGFMLGQALYGLWESCLFPADVTLRSLSLTASPTDMNNMIDGNVQA